MDVYSAALNRLKNHANLLSGRDAEDFKVESLSHQLWLADRTGTPPNLELLNDVVSSLRVLNDHLNRPDPNTRTGPRTEQIPPVAAYSVACIISCCLQYHREWSRNQKYPAEVLALLLAGTHRVSHCWMQLLASDVTDLDEGFESS